MGPVTVVEGEARQVHPEAAVAVAGDAVLVVVGGEACPGEKDEVPAEKGRQKDQRPQGLGEDAVPAAEEQPRPRRPQ